MEQISFRCRNWPGLCCVVGFQAVVGFQDINDLCSRDFYIRFGDDKVLCSRAFCHLLVMDGAEVAAALLCAVNQCPVCTCPHSELNRTDVSYPYRNTESVKSDVDAARSEHLDDDGEVKERHKD
jgi:hypothetical protein